jgi:phosphatidylglycerophosphate synthase
MTNIYYYLFNNNYQPKNAGFVDKHVVYPITNLFSSFIYKLGITPNQITFITLFLRSFAINNLYYKSNPNLIFRLFLISWFTDTLDGIIARKYNMCSEFGAHLDGIVDAITLNTTLGVLYFKYYINNPKPFYIIIFIFIIHYGLMIIKLRNNKTNNKNSKPWEKAIAYLPINFKSNCLINNIDPGSAYIIFLYNLYYALFINKN